MVTKRRKRLIRSLLSLRSRYHRWFVHVERFHPNPSQEGMHVIERGQGTRHLVWNPYYLMAKFGRREVIDQTKHPKPFSNVPL